MSIRVERDGLELTDSRILLGSNSCFGEAKFHYEMLTRNRRWYGRVARRETFAHAYICLRK